MELHLRSDFLFLLHGKTDGIQYEIHTLTCSCFARNHAVVKQIPNHGQIEYTLSGMDEGNIRDPFVVGSVRLKVSVQSIFVFVKLLAHLPHTAVSISLVAFLLLLADDGGKLRIVRRLIQALDIVIAATA